MINAIAQYEFETELLAADIGLVVRAGDLLMVSGDLGAGKSVFARGLIRYLADESELEIPSPTYTIAQSYETDPPVSHYDLYRLSGMDELDELGWEDQLDLGVLIMEWPERCFDEIPSNAVHIRICQESETERSFTISGNPDFLARIARSLEIRTFLGLAGHRNASRRSLSGDASIRSYERINGHELLVMNSPKRSDGPPVRGGKTYSEIAHLAEDVSAFVAIDRMLLSRGISVPKIHACDIDRGLLLTEHFGHEGIVDSNRFPIEERYLASVDFLAHLHSIDLPQWAPFENDRVYHIPRYDETAMMIEVELLLDWYVKDGLEKHVDETRFHEIWRELIARLENVSQTLVLRDFHSPNILWLKERDKAARIGVIDFQDAVIGPSAYDVASIAQDARVTVSQELEETLIRRYCDCRRAVDDSFCDSDFKSSYAIMAAQRATKILGIFVRLDVRDGKPEYRNHIPRLKDYLSRSLMHPVLKDYRNWLNNVIEL